jgi:hypothetical protein
MIITLSYTRCAIFQSVSDEPVAGGEHAAAEPKHVEERDRSMRLQLAFASLRPLDPAFPIERQIELDASPVVLVNVFTLDKADEPTFLKV